MIIHLTCAMFLNIFLKHCWKLCWKVDEKCTRFFDGVFQNPMNNKGFICQWRNVWNTVRDSKHSTLWCCPDVSCQPWRICWFQGSFLNIKNSTVNTQRLKTLRANFQRLFNSINEIISFRAANETSFTYKSNEH